MKEPLYSIVLTIVEILGHSIWLGLFCALLYFFFIRTNHRLKPVDRVWLGLVLLASVPAGSFLFVAFNIACFILPPGFQIPVKPEVIHGSFAVWLIGFLISSLRSTIGYTRLRRIRNLAKPYPELAISKLKVLVSHLLKGPCLVGFLHPAILLPHTVLDRSRACLDSILAHELAHHRRGDTWFNLGQTIIEWIYFFHPAVRWLSSEIRMEREKACDDLAVELLGGKRIEYASALLETESNLSPPGCLVAAFGATSTSDRATRIAFGERKPSMAQNSLLAFLSLSIIILMYIATSSVLDARHLYNEAISEETAAKSEVLERDFANPEIGYQQWPDRSIPMFKSIPIIERNGILYDLRKETPRLFESLPNTWILDSRLDFLDSKLPYLDSDGDRFTNLEEFLAGTDPMEPGSAPDRIHLIDYLGAQHQLYRVRFSARMDEKTIQFHRLSTALHPDLNSFFLRTGETSKDGRIRLESISPDEITIKDLSLGTTRSLSKGAIAEFRISFAEFRVREAEESFFVREGGTFRVPQSDTEWKLKSVSKTEAAVENVSTRERLVLPSKDV